MTGAIRTDDIQQQVCAAYIRTGLTPRMIEVAYTENKTAQLAADHDVDMSTIRELRDRWGVRRLSAGKRDDAIDAGVWPDL